MAKPRSRSAFVIGRDRTVKLKDGTVIGHVEQRADGWVGFLASGGNASGKMSKKTAGEAGAAVYSAYKTGTPPPPAQLDMPLRPMDRSVRQAAATEELGPPSPEYTGRKERDRRVQLCAEWYMREEGKSKRQAFAMCNAMADKNRLREDGSYIAVRRGGRRDAPEGHFDQGHVEGLVRQVAPRVKAPVVKAILGETAGPLYTVYARGNLRSALHEANGQRIRVGYTLGDDGRMWVDSIEHVGRAYGQSGSWGSFKRFDEVFARFGTGDFAKGPLQVWYLRDESLWKRKLLRPRPGKMGGWNVSQLASSHVLLGSVAPRDPQVIRAYLQADYWSPSGEADALARSLGTHVSLSPGDVLVQPDGTVEMLLADGSFERVGRV